MPDDDKLPRSLSRGAGAPRSRRCRLCVRAGPDGSCSHGRWLRACLDGSVPWLRMVSEFPELINMTSLTQQEVARLYRVYVEEWGSNEDAVRSNGLARRESRTVALCLMTTEARPGNPHR